MRQFTRLTFATAVVLAAAAGPALADPTGFIAGGIGLVSTGNNNNYSANGPAAAIRGSGTVELSPALSLQGDLVLNYRRYNEEGEFDFDLLDVDAALHLFHRDPESHLLGGFVQINSQRAADEDDVWFSRSLMAGAEAQAYLGDLTLYGALGYRGIGIDGYAEYLSGYFASAEVRYFLTPDLRLDVHGFLSQTLRDENSDIFAAGIGAGVEYRLPESPLSVFGTADLLSTQYGSVYSATDARVMVGLKFNFGSESLQDQDRNGTTLNPFQPMPYTAAAD